MIILDMLNSTIINQNDDIYYNSDSFPLSYEDDDFNSSSISLNRSYYDDFLLNLNPKVNKTNSSSILSLSSPFTYIILIIICYLILTIILLTFSLYRQRQTEIENFYFGDSDEEIEQGKRYLAWKQLLIKKIRKGDMDPLLFNGKDQQINTETFPFRVCYFTNWGVHRSIKEARLRPEDIPADLCTHIFYAFASIGGLTLQAKHPNDLKAFQGEEPLYPRIMKLKEKNPDLKIIISCGGWGNSGEFDSIATSQSSRETFSTNAIAFCRQHGFDGVDLDWEFPTTNQRENFGLLVKTMHKAFKKEAKKSKKDRLLIGLAVAAGKLLIKQGYDVPVLCHYVDMINVMTYDMYGSWTNKIGHHSALFHRRGEKGMERDLNTNSSMYHWIKAGCPRDRLLVGIPGYGRAFTATGDDPLKAYGQPGGVSSISSPYLGESGLLAFYEICKNELKEGFKRYWHKQHQISISFKDGTWIGYDDPESVRNKCEYVKREGFGGVMIWALDMDDFSGKFCRKNRKSRLRRFPLVNAMKEVFENDEITTEMTTIPIQTTTLSNETILLNEEFKNLLDQMFEEASSSSKFFQTYFIVFYILIINYLRRS